MHAAHNEDVNREFASFSSLRPFQESTQVLFDLRDMRQDWGYWDIVRGVPFLASFAEGFV